ncbi:MAG TPA: serine/threonine-protein kinase [Kofleriaceae bacterium]|nr:serine/threonine-protein kinase [Kofleriaceae bacterium]
MTNGGDHTSDSLDETDAAGDRATWPDLPIGVLVSRYVTTGVLGRGGMGVVYSAHDPVLRRPVALKLVHSTHPASAGRLIREAQALARLSNPHVVAVYDAGEYEHNQVFIAMQHVDGQDLATVLAQRRSSAAQILEWFVAAGRGLAAAHAAGLVHRDFKPANVLLDRSGNVAVTDFGLAREVLPNGQARQTNQGALAGTPAYMSPEQLGLMPATQASDQFSFCLTLWEALFHQHPFVEGPLHALSPVEIGCAIIESPLLPPPRLGDVPRRVVDALMRGLERTPTARWPSMPALLAAIAPTPRLRRWPILVAGLAGAGAATTAALLIAMLDRDASQIPGDPGAPAVPGDPASSGPSPATAPAGGAPDEASLTRIAQPASGGLGEVAGAPEPSTITLGLTVDPPGAAIAIDGARVEGSEIVVQKDAAAHLLRITAPGYIEHDTFIKFDESQQLSVQLRRARSRPSAPGDDRAQPPRSDLIDVHSPYH